MSFRTSCTQSGKPFGRACFSGTLCHNNDRTYYVGVSPDAAAPVLMCSASVPEISQVIACDCCGGVRSFGIFISSHLFHAVVIACPACLHFCILMQSVARRLRAQSFPRGLLAYGHYTPAFGVCQPLFRIFSVLLHFNTLFCALCCFWYT